MSARTSWCFMFHLVVRARTQIKIEVADAAQKGHVNDIHFSAFEHTRVISTRESVIAEKWIPFI